MSLSPGTNASEIRGAQDNPAEQAGTAVNKHERQRRHSVTTISEVACRHWHTVVMAAWWITGVVSDRRPGSAFEDERRYLEHLSDRADIETPAGLDVDAGQIRHHSLRRQARSACLSPQSNILRIGAARVR